MKNILSKILLSAVLLILVNINSAKSQESLYKRIGGYDAIALVSDDFIGKLASDKQLSVFVKGLSVDSQKRLRQHLVDFLCNATGGPCLYLGRDMKTAHTGLNISESDWNLAANMLAETLDKFNVGSKEKDEVLGAVVSIKGQIVGQ
jgi:hemoglobin